MKIAILTENAYAGGLDTFLTNLINYWPNTDDELILICNHAHPGLEAVRNNLRRECTVIAHRIPLQWSAMHWTDRLPQLVGKALTVGLRYFFFLSYMPQLRRLLNKISPNRLLIVNGGYPGGDTCRAAALVWARDGKREKSIHNFHNLGVPVRWWEAWIENRIDAAVERSSKQILSTSNASAESIRVRPSMSGSTKIGFIYNGTEGPQAKTGGANTIREELSIPPNSPIVAMLGTYEPRKGHRFLLEAFSQVRKAVPDAHLVISGFGQPEEVERVEGYVDELDLRASVHVEGFWIDRHDLMEEASVVVVSAQGFESFGLTLVEAMSHKVPVVSTRIGGTVEVMHEDEGGFSVETRDLEGFADRIVLLLTKGDVWQEKSNGGYQRYLDHFRIERVSADYAAEIHGTSSAIAEEKSAF